MKGFSLIEVMICFFLLSLILLAFDALEMTAIKQSKETFFLTQAENQMMNYREWSRSTSQNIIEEWNKQNSVILPHGWGEKNDSKLTLYWGKKKEFCQDIQLGEANCLTEML